MVDRAFRVGSFFSPARAGEKTRPTRTSDRTNNFITEHFLSITRIKSPKCRDVLILQDPRIPGKLAFLLIFAYGIYGRKRQVFQITCCVDDLRKR